MSTLLESFRINGIPTPSALIVKALKLELPQIPSPFDDVCSFCGISILKDSPHGGPFSPGAGFSDGRSLATSHPRLLCSCCAAITPKHITFTTQRTLICAQGLLSIGTTEERAWMLLTPPEPPFYAMLSDATLQHLAWRTPPTLSVDYIKLRIGNRLLGIDRPKVFLALTACERIEAARRLFEKDKETAKIQVRHPFIMLDPNGREHTHAQWKPKTLQAAKAHNLQKDITLLDSLGYGELWALGVLARPNLAPAPFPRFITLKEKTS